MYNGGVKVICAISLRNIQFFTYLLSIVSFLFLTFIKIFFLS